MQTLSVPRNQHCSLGRVPHFPVVPRSNTARPPPCLKPTDTGRLFHRPSDSPPSQTKKLGACALAVTNRYHEKSIGHIKSTGRPTRASTFQF